MRVLFCLCWCGNGICRFLPLEEVKNTPMHYHSVLEVHPGCRDTRAAALIIIIHSNQASFAGASKSGFPGGGSRQGPLQTGFGRLVRRPV